MIMIMMIMMLMMIIMMIIIIIIINIAGKRSLDEKENSKHYLR